MEKIHKEDVSMSLSEDLRKIFLVGIGAMAITGEKALEIVDILAAKGDLTMEQGKVLNQELRCAIKKTLQKSEGACVVEENDAPQEGLSLSQILDRIDSLTIEELVALEDKLAGRKCEQ